MDPSTNPLTREEAARYRAEAAAGKMPSLDIIRRFVLTIRKDWASKPKEKVEGKSRVTKPKVDENQIDFF